MFTPTELAALELESLTLLQELIRIPTWQPEHCERPAAELLAERLTAAGLAPQLLEVAPGRTNLVARLRGTGELPPLLLAGHLDTVPPGPSEFWQHAPLGGEIHDGWLHGRGVADMKGMVALCATLLCGMARAGVRPRRDLILAAVADEETGCRLGSQFLVREHPDLVRAEQALGEVGGFTQWMGGLPVYPIQVAEKGTARLRLTVRGEAGHASMPDPDAAVIRLAELVARLGRARLPIHETRTMRAFLAGLAPHLPRPRGWVLTQLLDRRLGPLILERLVTDRRLRLSLGALLSNTVCPVMVRAGEPINQIPAVATCDLDGRTLPGQAAEDLVRELRVIIGAEAELELLDQSMGVEWLPEAGVEGGLLQIIREEVTAAHPGAVVLPSMIPGFTDGRAFATLGIRWAGFFPVRMPPPGPALPAAPSFSELIHAANERLPVEGLSWGFRVLQRVIGRFVR